MVVIAVLNTLRRATTPPTTLYKPKSDAPNASNTMREVSIPTTATMQTRTKIMTLFTAIIYHEIRHILPVIL